MSQAILIQPKFSRDKRILVTSDIHGHVRHLKKLLQKAAFSDQDILIIVGDFLEKGPDSLKTLQYVMQLCKRGNTYALLGNVDLNRLLTIQNLLDDPSGAADFLAYLQMMRDWKGTSLFDEMCRELEILPQNETELLQSIRPVCEHFAKEFHFLKSLPYALEAENYLFVHGGIPSPHTESTLSAIENPQMLLKFDHFITHARKNCHRFSHTVVCGHWPVSLYSDTVARQTPIYDPITNIISMDGGCGLKKEPQLNLLILPSICCKPEEIHFIAYDALPVITALDAQTASTDSVHIHWGDTAGKVLSINEDSVLVEHLRSKRQFQMPKDDLYNTPEVLSVGAAVDLNDWTDLILKVQPHDRLSVVRTLPYGLQVKKEGITGWYYGKFIENFDKDYFYSGHLIDFRNIT